MSQSVVQSASASITVLLTKNNVGVTGLTYTGVAVEYCQAGGSFTSLTLSSGNFTEIGLGYYNVTFTGTELSVLGPFLVVTTGGSIDTAYTQAQVVAAANDTQPTSLQTCIVTGYVFDAMGEPIVNAAVSARPVGLPSIEQSAAALTDDLVTAVTDSNGQFFLKLVRLVDVEIFIPVANLRRRVVVPNSATFNIFSLA